MIYYFKTKTTAWNIRYLFVFYTAKNYYWHIFKSRKIFEMTFTLIDFLPSSCSLHLISPKHSEGNIPRELPPNISTICFCRWLEVKWSADFRILLPDFWQSYGFLNSLTSYNSLLEICSFQLNSIICIYIYK